MCQSCLKVTYESGVLKFYIPHQPINLSSVFCVNSLTCEHRRSALCGSRSGHRTLPRIVDIVDMVDMSTIGSLLSEFKVWHIVITCMWINPMDGWISPLAGHRFIPVWDGSNQTRVFSLFCLPKQPGCNPVFPGWDLGRMRVAGYTLCLLFPGYVPFPPLNPRPLCWN